MKTLKQFRPKLMAAAVLLGLSTLSGNASAEMTGGGLGEILGDLVVLLRDVNGVPILTPEGCQQPLDASGVPIPLDVSTCAVLAGYESSLQAMEFGRLSVVRAPEKVMAKQLEDVLANLLTAQTITLDPAGRLVFSKPDTSDGDGDGNTTELVSRAIDSPLQNLAIYMELMTKGALGSPAITLPVPFNGHGMLDIAAATLGAAADKQGKIDVDVLVYMNQVMGLDLKTTQTQLPKICITITQEIKGVVQPVEKCFLDYSAYNYNRVTTYGSLPFPASMPAENPQPGFFDYLTLYPDLKTLNDNKPLFHILSASIVPTVFPNSIGGGLPGFTGGNIGGFAQASDDARAVINFMHSHPVLPSYEAPVLPAKIECLFNWAEGAYSNVFVPPGAVTKFMSEYTYRYYSANNIYLGVSATDQNVYWMLGSDGILHNVGPLSGWLTTSGCQ
jgi:hypothetical protein